MRRRSSHRLTTLFLMVLSLLFSQLALANYACPGQSDAAAMATMMAAGQPVDMIARTMHIHPTVSELVPTLLQQLKPMS